MEEEEKNKKIEKEIEEEATGTSGDKE